MSNEQVQTLGLDEAPLGKESAYPDSYDASLLFPIPRTANRVKLGDYSAGLPFAGFDQWNAYEISWLNEKGKPEVRLATFFIPADSENIIESKSFKLYLNSFNQTRFCSEHKVIQTMQKDLSRASASEVVLSMVAVDAELGFTDTRDWLLLDGQDVAIDTYDVCQDYLSVVLPESKEAKKVSEKLCSHLLKSNCPVTGQPDWATVLIEYKGDQIDHEGLLKYLVSFRNHQDFHEHCVERIFIEISRQCQPEALCVTARYTRRGGLDINPVRFSLNLVGKISTLSDAGSLVRLCRQ